jgi:hypothetical protein
MSPLRCALRERPLPRRRPATAALRVAAEQRAGPVGGQVLQRQQHAHHRYARPAAARGPRTRRCRELLATSVRACAQEGQYIFPAEENPIVFHVRLIRGVALCACSSALKRQGTIRLKAATRRPQR